MKTVMYTINIKRHKTRRELLRQADTIITVVAGVLIVAALLFCGAALGRVFA